MLSVDAAPDGEDMMQVFMVIKLCDSVQKSNNMQ